MAFEHFVTSAAYRLSNFGLWLAQRLLFSWRLPSEPKTILVYRVGHLGDTLCAVPALSALRKQFPSAKLVLMTNLADGNLPAAKDVLDPLVNFDEVLTYNPAQLHERGYVDDLLTRVRTEKVDLLVYLGLSIATPIRLFRDMLFFKAAGCKAACGFKVDTLRIFVKAQRAFRHFDQEAVRLLKLISPLGISQEVVWRIPRVSVNGLLSNLPEPIVAIHPTAKYASKKWPVERFARVAQYLQEHHQASVVLMGGGDTKPEAEVLLKALKGQVLDLTGRTTFLEGAAVLRRCAFLLSNDSGPVHLAAAVSTPVVGIYSARDFPNAWYPWGENHKILRKDVDCQICYLETCPVMTCIKNITVEEVIAACEQVLQTPARDPSSPSGTQDKSS